MWKNKNQAKTVTLKRSSLIMIIILTFVLLLAFLTSILFIFKAYNKNFRALAGVMNLIQENYYEDTDENALEEAAISGYVDALNDPYSNYKTSAEFEAYQDKEAGVDSQLGMSVTATEDGYMEIQSVTEDSGAEDAGIQVGDVITYVNGQNILELGYEEAVSQLQAAQEGDTITLIVKRDTETLTMDVTAKEVEVITAGGTMLDNNIGYIYITNFRANTVEQFQTAYEDLLNQGAEGFIFDVRNNGGGLCTSVGQILDPLLPEGDIAQEIYRDGSTSVMFSSDAEECELPMVVLVNENTASAAELFSASLRDFQSVQLIGKNTYGKGVMQTTYSLSNGGALTLTVAKYSTTVGECYQGVGLAPDVEVEEKDSDVIDPTNPNAETDTQLQSAIDTLLAQ